MIRKALLLKLTINIKIKSISVDGKKKKARIKIWSLQNKDFDCPWDETMTNLSNLIMKSHYQIDRRQEEINLRAFNVWYSINTFRSERSALILLKK